MKTPFHHIFDTDSVGQIINPLPLNHLLRWANLEQIEHDEQCPKTLFLGIDIQQDFMDNGALGVPGAMQDVIRLGQFIYNNIEKYPQLSYRSIRMSRLRYFILIGGWMRQAIILHRIRSSNRRI